MIKTIRVSQLRTGMYVCNLHRSWLKHSFFFNKFLLDSPKKLQKILASGITEVEIDTEKGLDVAESATFGSPSPGKFRSAAKPPEGIGLEKSLPKVQMEERLVYPIPLQAEIQMARRVLADAHQVIEKVMSDVRFGRQINLQEVDQTVNHITDSILQSPDALIGLSRLKSRDNYTFQHSVGVCALLISFCKDSGMDIPTIKKIATGGLLQDIGKMQLPMEILTKKGKLTHEEYQMMQKHVDFSRKILQRTPSIPQIAVMIASQHHERCDGSGYPAHVGSLEISEYAQMAAIADMYDAAISQRPYRRVLEPTEALLEIYEMRHTFLDSELVERFIKFIGIYPAGCLVALDNGLLGFVIRTNRDNLLLPVVRIIYDSLRNCPIPPHDVDLSKPTALGIMRHIVSHESPEKWGIDPSAIF